MSPDRSILYVLYCSNVLNTNKSSFVTGESLGFLLRIFISQPKLRTSLGYYIAMYFLVVLSPATFLAFNYIIYGRLIRLCVGRQHSFIRPEWVGKTFVWSDVLTLIVQVLPLNFML